MNELAWIIVGGVLMSAIAAVGGITVLLQPATLERILLPLVSLAAGSLLGGAFFHMIPEGSAAFAPLVAAAWLMAGFSFFLALEQFLHWHHSHRRGGGREKPVTYLILIGDGLHNFIGGLSIASTFLINPQAGISAWIASALHEVPQELGDFGVLVHSGWPRRRALFWNLVSASTFPLGALLAYVAARQVETAGLVLFGAGNFLYIAASDLIPEIKPRVSLASGMWHVACFIGALVFMYLLALGFRH